MKKLLNLNFKRNALVVTQITDSKIYNQECSVKQKETFHFISSLFYRNLKLLGFFHLKYFDFRFEASGSAPFLLQLEQTKDCRNVATIITQSESCNRMPV